MLEITEITETNDPKEWWSRVLIVEDDSEAHEFIRIFLAKKGINCVVAENGQVGLNLWMADTSIRIVLTDIFMPLMLGPDMIRAIRAIDQGVRILVMSSFADLNSVMDCVKLGANDFIQKPYKPNQLFESLLAQYKELNIEMSARDSMLNNEFFLNLNSVLAKAVDSSRLASIVLGQISNFFGFSDATLFKISGNAGDCNLKMDLFGTSLDSTKDVESAAILADFDPTNISALRVYFPFCSPESSSIQVNVNDPDKFFLVVGPCNKVRTGIMATAHRLKVIADGLPLIVLYIQSRLRLGSQQAERDSKGLMHLAFLGEVSASIVHDISNPLTVVVHHTNKLAERTDFELETQVVLGKISRNVKLIVDIVRSFSNLMRGAADDEFSKVYLSELTNSSIGALDQKSQISAVSIVVQGTNCDLVEVYCQPSKIIQVLVNLLSNAIDATDKEKSASVFIECSKLPSKVEFKVKNIGEAIPDHIREQIFEKFYTTKASDKGTGLGLYISSTIVKSHGGELEYVRENGYTCFKFGLPLVECYAPISAEKRP